MASQIKIRDNSKEIVGLFKKAKHRGLEAIGLAAEGHAKKAIKAQDAIDTGTLLNSITYAIAGYQTHVQEYRRQNIAGGAQSKHTYHSYGSETMEGEKDSAVYIGTNVEYAPHVELGTSKMEARPYLKPAATEHGAEYKKLMESALKNG